MSPSMRERIIGIIDPFVDFEWPPAVDIEGRVMIDGGVSPEARSKAGAKADAIIALLTSDEAAERLTDLNTTELARGGVERSMTKAMRAALTALFGDKP